MKTTVLISLLGAATLGANPAADYVNFIRQIQKDSGVEWDVSVASSGSALSPEGVTLDGAFFELWAVHGTEVCEHLLDEQFVSAYLPGSGITIETLDPYRAIARTRVDQPFTVTVDVRGLLKNDGMVQSFLNHVDGATDATPPEELAYDPELLKSWEELQAAADKAAQEKANAEQDIEEAKQRADTDRAKAESDYLGRIDAAQQSYDADFAKLVSDYNIRFANVEATYVDDVNDAETRFANDVAGLNNTLSNEFVKADGESDPVKAQEIRTKAQAEYDEDYAKKLADYNNRMAQAEANYTADMTKYQTEFTSKQQGLAEDLTKATTDAEDRYLKDSADIDEDLANAVEKGISKIDGIELSFVEEHGDDALELGAGDPDRVMKADASRVFFSHEVHTYPEGVFSVDGFRLPGKPIQEGYINGNGLWSFHYELTNLKATDLTSAAGEEVFSISSLAGYEISGTVLDSKKVQIWPIARGNMWGFDTTKIYDILPAVKLDLYDLYPSSKTYLRTYPGPPQSNPDEASVRTIPDSYVILDDSIPQNRGMILKNVDYYLVEEGRHTLEVLHETPFGTDILAQTIVLVDRTITSNGGFYSGSSQ